MYQISVPYGQWFKSHVFQTHSGWSNISKNYVRVIAEFSPGELYTDQYKVKVIDLVSKSRYKVNNQDHSIGTKMMA